MSRVGENLKRKVKKSVALWLCAQSHMTTRVTVTFWLFYLKKLYIYIVYLRKPIYILTLPLKPSPPFTADIWSLPHPQSRVATGPHRLTNIVIF